MVLKQLRWVITNVYWRKMVSEQLSLFPNPKPLIKNIDFIDVSEIECVQVYHERRFKYSDLTPGKYTLFKTGGSNKWKSELGNVFPYIYINDSKKIMVGSRKNTYIRVSFKPNNYTSLDQLIHRLVAEAFVIRDHPKKVIVDHINGDRLDYRVTNLRWVTAGQNSTGVKKPRDDNYEDRN